MNKYKLKSKSRQQGIWLLCWVLIHTVGTCRKFTFKAGLHLVFCVTTNVCTKHQSRQVYQTPRLLLAGAGVSTYCIENMVSSHLRLSSESPLLLLCKPAVRGAQDKTTDARNEGKGH